jgi:hypothetical protein
MTHLRICDKLLSNRICGGGGEEEEQVHSKHANQWSVTFKIVFKHLHKFPLLSEAKGSEQLTNQ